MATTEEIIGRSSIDDIEGILAITNSDVDSSEHLVPEHCDAIFTWEYEPSRSALNRLYEKAKTSQWNASTDLDWSIDVDQEKVAAEMAVQAQLDQSESARRLETALSAPDSPVARWGEKEWSRFRIESQNWTLSQFMHGEQGALICTAKIVETVPWIDAKYYASTQVMDEARHVEVFSRYLREKLSGIYPMNAHLGALIDDIIADTRWDMTYLGMQVMVEGLALAAFGFMHQMTSEPLLKTILRYVMADEARHVAFGVLSLKEIYDEMDEAEIRLRQEFAFEAAVRMRDRFLQQEVWERMGVDVREMVKIMVRNRGDRTQDPFQAMLFSKIVPNCRKLGLLDAGDGWLRDRFTEMGVIVFENLTDTSEEYLELDEVAKDRAAQTG